MRLRALQLIDQYDTIIIHRHTNPDGDAIGSQVGLCRLIRHNYPHKTVYMVGDSAGRYGFVEGSTMDTVADAVYEHALAIVLDTSARALISDNRYRLAEAVLRIDHHMFCETIAPVEVVDTSCESCCGLITDLSRTWGWRMPSAAAQALFTGMVTDSGRFRYDCAGADTFGRAQYLMQCGVDSNSIYNNLYADDYAKVRLKAQFTLKIQFTQHNVAYIYTPMAEWQSMGLDAFGVSRGMVGTMADLKGVYAWANLTQTADGVVCELRSNRYNIQPIAAAFGGGGHAKACGCTVPDVDTAMQVVAALDALVAKDMED